MAAKNVIHRFKDITLGHKVWVILVDEIVVDGPFHNWRIASPSSSAHGYSIRTFSNDFVRLFLVFNYIWAKLLVEAGVYMWIGHYCIRKSVFYRKISWSINIKHWVRVFQLIPKGLFENLFKSLFFSSDIQLECSIYIASSPEGLTAGFLFVIDIVVPHFYGKSE